MQHLTEEQLVLHHYHDGDGAAEVEKHLASCAECRAQFETLRRVLALVDTMPIPERGERYGEEVWTRLRWKLGSERRRFRNWQLGFAAAAVLAIAFVSGILWHQRTTTQQQPQIATTSTGPSVRPASAPIVQPQPNQILLVVVSDHLDQSERMLMEVANADSKRSYDMSGQSKRAEDLVASNRIYRLTAQQRGETRIASLLSDLEPVLLELAHAGRSLTPEELGTLQKRIDDKGLLFKVRVVNAQTKGTDSL
jgi:hypothetical protein